MSAPASEPVLVLEAGRAERHYWLDLWRYRELFAILAWRDLAVRYKQTVIGIAWALVRPLLTMLIFTFVFGRLAKLHSDGSAPYPVMVFAGLMPWTLFSSILPNLTQVLPSWWGTYGWFFGVAIASGTYYVLRLMMPPALQHRVT